MKTGVVIHGCNLHIENWRHVAWGDSPDRPGRIPQGILVALRFDAEVIVMGTGASEAPFHFGESDDEAPIAEAEYARRYLSEFFDELRQFRVINEELKRSGPESFPAWRESLLEKIVLDVRSRNTLEEIENASAIFLERGIGQIVLVSSPSHVVRCLRDAAGLYAREPHFAHLQCNLLATPSVTCYEGSTPDDVVVVEPPHRPDRHVLPTHRRIQRMLDLQQMAGGELVNLIEDFDELLQHYEHLMFQRGKSRGP